MSKLRIKKPYYVLIVLVLAIFSSNTIYGKKFFLKTGKEAEKNELYPIMGLLILMMK